MAAVLDNGHRLAPITSTITPTIPIRVMARSDFGGGR
jgi:hypothetical protein